MKKIKNIGQLKAEQQRLKEQQLELEELIDDDWYEIKDSLRPKNITRQVFSAVFSKPEPGESKSIFKYLASFAAAGIAGKLLNKLKRKVAGMFS